MVSEVSVMLLACGRAEYHSDRKAWWSKAIHFTVARKRARD
jgi:hypothetical protein